VHLPQSYSPGAYVNAKIVDNYDFDLVGDAPEGSVIAEPSAGKTVDTVTSQEAEDIVQRAMASDEDGH